MSVCVGVEGRNKREYHVWEDKGGKNVGGKNHFSVYSIPKTTAHNFFQKIAESIKIATFTL